MGTWRRWPSSGARELIAAGSAEPEVLEVALSDKAPYQHGVQCCGGEVKLLLEPLPVVPSVAIFGVGHVGLELARILARHDIELHLVDSRPDQLTAERLAVLDDAVAQVHVHHVPVLPELVVGELPPGTHALVMTHDHAEDAALCDAAIRNEQLATIGLIGSQAKWARFRRKLAEDGNSEEAIDRITTPIGLPDLPGKEPAIIAVSVAAWLLQRFSAERHPRRPDLPSVAPRRPSVRRRHDHLPRHVPRYSGQPVHRRQPAGRLRRRTAGQGRRDRCPRPLPGDPAGAPGRAGRRPDAVASYCPGSWTRTCTSRRSGPSAGSGCRCSSGSIGTRCPRRRGWRTSRTPRGVAAEFVRGLAAAGTTSALVFGAHYADAVDALFNAASRVGLRITSGLVAERPAAAAGAADHTGPRVRRIACPGQPLARRRPEPVRRDASLLAVVHG